MLSSIFCLILLFFIFSQERAFSRGESFNPEVVEFTTKTWPFPLKKSHLKVFNPPENSVPTLVFFDYPYFCSKCEEFSKVWSELTPSKTNKQITFAKVDSYHERNITLFYKINKFPSILLFQGPHSDKTGYTIYQGGLELGSIKRYLNKHLCLYPSYPCSFVHELTSEEEESKLENSHRTVVISKLLSDSEAFQVLKKISPLSELSSVDFYQSHSTDPSQYYLKLIRSDSSSLTLESIPLELQSSPSKLQTYLYSWILDNRLPLITQVTNISSLPDEPYHLILVLSKDTSEEDKSYFSHFFEDVTALLRTYKSDKRQKLIEEREILEKQFQSLIKLSSKLDEYEDYLNQKKIDDTKKKIAFSQYKIEFFRRDWSSHFLYREDNQESLPLWGIEETPSPTFLVYHNYTYYPWGSKLDRNVKAVDIVKFFKPILTNETLPYTFSEPLEKNIDISILQDPVFKIIGKSIRFYLNPVRWPYIDDWGVPSDVFLLAYSSKSPISENYLKLWERLSKRLEDVNHLLVAKIDLDKNWTPFSRERVPRLIFYPAHKKQESVEYFGPLQIEDLRLFVKETTSLKRLLPWKNVYPESSQKEDVEFEKGLGFRIHGKEKTEL